MWPKLLGLNPYSLSAGSFRAAAGLGHSDASIVYEDVKRSSWIRLYVDGVGEAAKGLVEQQQQGALQRLINGVVCSNLDTVHYVQGLHEVAAVCLMTLGEDMAFHVLELILLHHLHDSRCCAVLCAGLGLGGVLLLWGWLLWAARSGLASWVVVDRKRRVKRF